jgi:HAD superfamily hydrolase (TIGR01509 family)
MLKGTMKKILLLDADGVAIVPREQYFSDRYSEEFGVSKDVIMPFFKNEFNDCLIGKREVSEVFAEQNILEKWGWKGTLPELFQYWWAGENKRFEEVLSFVQELRAQGVKCYLTTDQERNRAEYIMHGMRLAQDLDGAFFSYLFGARKTDAEYWRKLLAELGNPNPADVEFWDDDEENVATAKAAGIDAHFFTNFEDFKKSVQK